MVGDTDNVLDTKPKFVFDVAAVVGGGVVDDGGGGRLYPRVGVAISIIVST